MSSNSIKLTGLTPMNKIPKSVYNSPHNEMPKSFKLGISKNEPEIKRIISLDVKINIKSHQNLFTLSSRKVILNAVKNIDLVYYSPNNTVHTVKFNLPFDIPITLKNSTINLKKVLTYVTKLSIKMLSPRSFYLYSNVFVASLIEHKSEPKASTQKINNQKDFRKASPRKRLPSKYEKLSNEDYTQNKNVNCTCNYTNNYNSTYYDNYWNFSYCLILVLIILSKFCPFNSYY